MSWKRVIGWALAAVAGLSVLAAVAGYFYLQSTSFRQFALRKIVEEADQSTGGHTQIRGLDFRLSTLTAHLYGVVIRGGESPDAPPLLQVDKLTVGLKIKSLLHRQVNLSELLIEHPVIHLQVGRNGDSNIPQAPPQNSSSHANIFDLAIAHAVLSNGEVDYNNRQTRLDADLFDLQADISYEKFATRYRGSISYDKGRLHYGQYSLLPHALKASFTATPSLFQLDSTVITVASSSIKLAAKVTNYTNPSAQGNYDVRLHMQDFGELAPATKPTGDIALLGTFQYKNVKDQPVLKNIEIQGDLASETLAATVATCRLDVRNLHATYRLADDSLRATVIRAESMGGGMNATVDVDHLEGAPASHVSAALHGISLSAAQRLVRGPAMAPLAITGMIDGTTEASWTGSVSKAHARVDLELRNTGARSPANNSLNVPVEGAIHAVYDGPRNAFTLTRTVLRIPDASVSAEGEISKRSHLQVHATASDLQRVAALVTALRHSSTELPIISGSATVDATLSGQIAKPEISAQVNARNLNVRGSEWKSAGFSMQAKPSQLVVSNGTLTNAGRGQASFDGAVALHDWSYVSSSLIQARVSLKQMQVADLQHLANVQYPLGGELSATVSFNGSQLAPRGSGSIEVANALAYREPLKAVALTFHGDSSSIVSELHIRADAGSARATFTYIPSTQGYKVRLDAPSIVLPKLRTVREKDIPIEGTLAISANGNGTIDDPQLTASLQLPKLLVKQKSIVGLKADISLAHKHAHLNLDSQVAQASVHAQGEIELSGDYQTEASIDTTSVPLEALLSAYSSQVPEGFSGETELHATLKGPLKNKSQVEAHLEVPRLSANYQSLQIEAASPIRADYSHSVITIQPSEIRGTGTSLRVQGSLPVGGTSAANLKAQGSIDAHIFRMFSPALQSSGTIALDIRASGSAASPQVAGQVRLQDLAFATPAVPLGVDQLNGTLDLDNERVKISRLTGQVGGGTVSASGSVTYRPSPQFTIAVQAEAVRLRYPAGLRSVLEGNLAWAGTQTASTMTGRVLVDSLSFTPDFDLSTFADQFSGNTIAPAQPGFADTVRLQIGVQSKANLSATSSQISVEGSANLNATGNLANPIITGRTDLTSGELFYRNVRYQLQHGIITFDDPNETNPTLDVSVATIVEQYNLTLNLRGPFDKLTTSYSSDPPLATADIINLIARGGTSSELAAQSQSTDSIVASQAASQVSGSVQKLAGISSLQIDPLFGGSNQNPSARVAIQQRVSKNFLFTFSTDVSQPGQEIVEGDYQINKRWSVSVSRDQVGGVTVDGRLHTRF